jgi:S1-C subfamily serine protease
MATAVNPSRTPSISIGSSLSAIAEWLRQITVRVHAGRSHGSGVIWRSQGLILTNAHVARSQEHEVELADGRTVQGWLVGGTRSVIWRLWRLVPEAYQRR